MSRHNYNLHLKGYVGGWDFDSDVVDYTLSKHPEEEVNILIDSLGGSLATALSIVAAFKNHGNVHVHYVGMNASAATIASLGAKHVSIDSSAMYLVHKCSMEFFQWASANSDKLSDIIKEAEQMKADLDKMDANVAQMYAAKCKRDAKDLLNLMKKGGWLTAKEALDWGFVDEVTDYEDDAAPVIDDRIAADMHTAGIPVPTGVHNKDVDRFSNNIVTRIVDAITNLFKSNTQMNPETQTPAVQQTPESQAQQPKAEQTQAPVATAQPAIPEGMITKEAHDSALAAKDDIIKSKEDAIKAKDEEIASFKSEIEALKAEVDKLKAAPGDSTSHVVDTQKNGEHPSEESVFATNFFASRQRAKELYNLLP